MMDELIDEFRNAEMPNRVHITTSCCQINCGGQGDIAINIQHTKPPKINHDLVANVCERPSVVARCPVAAIRPAMVNGKPSLEVDEKKCICCGACYPPCPPMQINDPEHSKLAVWVGGNHSNARSKPSFQKLVAAGIPNNPPRWPEATAVVKRILRVYKEDARDWSGSTTGSTAWAGLASSSSPSCRSPSSTSTTAGLAQELERLDPHTVLNPAKRLGMNAGERENSLSISVSTCSHRSDRTGTRNGAWLRPRR